MTIKNCGVLNQIMGRDKMGKTPLFIESSDGFITRPKEIDFNNYFISKVNTIRNGMLLLNGHLSESIIKKTNHAG